MDKRFLQVNLAILVLWGAGLLIEHLFGMPWLRWIVASMSILVLPGWNISFLLFPQLFSPLERALFGMLVSFPVFALGIYAAHTFFQIPFNATLVYAGMAIFLFGSLLAGIIGLARHPRLRTSRERMLKPLLLAVILYLALVIAIFVIYPFIPEADPYAFLALSKELLETGAFTWPDFRPLFVILVTSLSLLGNLPLGVIFKIVIPLFGGIMLVPLFLIARQYLRNPLAIFLAVLLPFSAPVLLLENVVARPQVVILFTLPGILYFLVKSLKRRSAWLAGAMFALSLVLFKFHELALLVMIPTTATLLVVLWPTIKREPKVAAAFALLAILALSPYLASSEILQVMRRTGALVIQQALSAPPQLWFLDHYSDIQESEMSWPGLTSIYYYAYNVGLTIPLLITTLLASKVSLRSALRLWPVILALGLFFLWAEGLPRLNIGYYPDRAWPFLILSLSIAALPLLAKLERHITRRMGQVVVTLTVLIGVGGALYITYAKQGLVTRKEYEAAQFVREKTPEGSVVISQGSNGPLVNYYANRIFLHADIFTTGITSATVSSILNNTPPHTGEIYILYSHDKFKYLYAIRSWWRNLNYADADLTKFDDQKYFEKVYDDDGQIFIWRAKS